MESVGAIMKNQEQFQSDLIKCLDCFTGADGGGTFIKFKFGMEEMAKRADNGDAGAVELCRIMSRFVRLIEAFNE
jgi:hypothetical protein